MCNVRGEGWPDRSELNSGKTNSPVGRWEALRAAVVAGGSRIEIG
jgi:hypothetical protein